MASINPIKGKIKPLRDQVFVTDMDFGETKTLGGIILRSDNAQAHGVKPRWGKVYAIGPDQEDVTVGQWILIEHGRWTRGMNIDDGNGAKLIQRVDVDCIMLVSDQEPTAADIVINDTL